MTTRASWPAGVSRRVVVAACALAAAIATFPSLAEAAFPGANGRIAYVATVAGEADSEIFTMLPDGSGIQRLTYNDVIEAQPEWSPDGTRLTFMTVGADPGSTIFVMNADGSDVTVLARSRTLAYPSFSPSGNRIIYVRKLRSIVTVRTDGSHRRRVKVAVDSWPRFSPDGRWIAFIGVPEGGRGGAIWKVRRNGTHLRRLTRNNTDYALDWAPDGRRIVFSRGLSSVWMMNANGKHKHEIPNTVGLTYPAFAPAGDPIAMATFIDKPPVPFCADIYTMTRDGLDPFQLTFNTSPGNCRPPEAAIATAPSWQPLPAPCKARRNSTSRASAATCMSARDRPPADRRAN